MLLDLLGKVTRVGGDPKLSVFTGSNYKPSQRFDQVGVETGLRFVQGQERRRPGAQQGGAETQKAQLAI